MVTLPQRIGEEDGDGTWASWVSGALPDLPSSSVRTIRSRDSRDLYQVYPLTQKYFPTNVDPRSPHWCLWYLNDVGPFESVTRAGVSFSYSVVLCGT